MAYTGPSRHEILALVLDYNSAHSEIPIELTTLSEYDLRVARNISQWNADKIEHYTSYQTACANAIASLQQVTQADLTLQIGYRSLDPLMPEILDNVDKAGRNLRDMIIEIGNCKETLNKKIQRCQEFNEKCQAPQDGEPGPHSPPDGLGGAVLQSCLKQEKGSILCEHCGFRHTCDTAEKSEKGVSWDKDIEVSLPQRMAALIPKVQKAKKNIDGERKIRTTIFKDRKEYNAWVEGSKVAQQVKDESKDRSKEDEDAGKAELVMPVLEAVGGGVDQSELVVRVPEVVGSGAYVNGKVWDVNKSFGYEDVHGYR